MVAGLPRVLVPMTGRGGGARKPPPPDPLPRARERGSRTGGASRQTAGAAGVRARQRGMSARRPSASARGGLTSSHWPDPRGRLEPFLNCQAGMWRGGAGWLTRHAESAPRAACHCSGWLGAVGGCWPPKRAEIPPLRSQACFGRDDRGELASSRVYPERSEWGRDDRGELASSRVYPERSEWGRDDRGML
jgi:hypothetical protein